jgi:hypothetical protein
MSGSFPPSGFPTIRMPSHFFGELGRSSLPFGRCRGGKGADPDDVRFSWSIAKPMWREWAEADGEALELF